MAVSYITEAEARQVTTALRSVAREIGEADPLHLIDYLGVSPGASFDTWKGKFREKEKAAQFANEGEADERIKLCTRLARDFVGEGQWRALMNRLGRIEIERQVAVLAKRGGSGEKLRARYETDIHTLAEIVGVPDAEAVVADIYREHGLAIPAAPRPAPPRPTAPPPRPETFELPRPQAPTQPRPEPTVQEEPTEDQTLLGAVGSFLLRSVADWADRKIDEQRQLQDQTPDIAGMWRAPDGSCFTFTQNGFNVAVSGFSLGAPIQGRGRIQGSMMEIQGFSGAAGPFRAMLQVSPDGRTIQGQVFDAYGNPSAVMLRR